MRNSGCVTWGKPASRYPTYGACWLFKCFHNPLNSDSDCRIFDVCTDVNACDWTRGCTGTLRESAQKVDSGRKIPCCTGELNLRQQCGGQMLYQLNYTPPVSYVCLKEICCVDCHHAFTKCQCIRSYQIGCTFNHIFILHILFSPHIFSPHSTFFFPAWTIIVSFTLKVQNGSWKCYIFDVSNICHLFSTKLCWSILFSWHILSHVQNISFVCNTVTTLKVSITCFLYLYF